MRPWAVICVNWTRTQSGHAASPGWIYCTSRTAVDARRLTSWQETPGGGCDDAVNTLGPVMFTTLSHRIHTFSDAHASFRKRSDANLAHQHAHEGFTNINYFFLHIRIQCGYISCSGPFSILFAVKFRFRNVPKFCKFSTLICKSQVWWRREVFMDSMDL